MGLRNLAVHVHPVADVSRLWSHPSASFRHFGVAPAQSPLAKQAVQRCVVARSQIGFTPEHCSIAVHSTQAFSVGSTPVTSLGVGATHAVELVDATLTHSLAPRSGAGVAARAAETVQALHAAVHRRVDTDLVLCIGGDAARAGDGTERRCWWRCRRPGVLPE